MKKYAAPLTLGMSCIAYGLVAVCAFYFTAKAQGATNVCDTDCLMQKMDAINQKTPSIRAGTAFTLQPQACVSLRRGPPQACVSPSTELSQTYMGWLIVMSVVGHAPTPGEPIMATI